MSTSSSPLPHQEATQVANALPDTTLAPSRSTLAPAWVTPTPARVQQALAPLHATLSQTRAAEQQAQGSDSLRSSDEFPANKENNHGRWHAPPAPTVKAVATADVHAAHVVSEQVLAQEAVFALQVQPHLCI